MILRRMIPILLALLLLLLPLVSAAEEEKENIPASELLWSRDTVLTENAVLTETVLDNGARQAEHYISYVPGGTVLPQLAFGSGIREKLDYAQVLEGAEDRVIAGLNGDYYVMASGMPLGLAVREGELLSSDDGNLAFGFREDGSAILGQPALRMTLQAGASSFSLSGINKSFRRGKLCLYTPDWGESTPASGNTWNVLLTPASGETLRIGGELRYTVESVSPSDGPVPISADQHILCLSQDSEERLLDFVTGLAKGTELSLSLEAGDPAFTDCVTALGCLYRLVRDGEVAEGLEKTDKSRAPRTSIGIRADGSVLFYTVDGRQPSYSAGLTLQENAERLLELGCVQAGTLDGGASTLLGVQKPGESACRIISEPSLGTVRKTPQFLFLTAPREETGELCTLSVYTEQKAVVCGGSLRLSFGGCDRNGAPVVPEKVEWSADRGSVDREGLFTAPSEAGEAVITVSCGSVSGSLRIPVVELPDSFSLRLEESGREVKTLQLLPGESAELTARAVWHTFPLETEDLSYTWTLEGQLGEISPEGTFTAGARAGKGTLIVTWGALRRELKLLVTDQVICLEEFEDGGSGSAEGLRWTGETLRDRAMYGFGSLRLDYDLEGGSAFFPMDGLETDLQRFATLWVQSDGSGNRLYSVHDEISLLLCELDEPGWMPLTVDTGTCGPILGLRLSGSGKGSLRLDQLVLREEAGPDTEAPVIRLSESGGTLTGEVRDLEEGVLPESLISLTADGEALAFHYDPETGRLTAELPVTVGAHHVLLKAADHSGNYHSASLFAGTAAEAPFADMGGHWAKDYVSYLYGIGIVNGREDPEGVLCYDPNTPMTRAEFAVMLCRWLKLEETETENAVPFADASEIPGWALDSVMAASARGLIQGSETDRGLCFLPGDPITRAQAAVLLGRTMPAGRMRADLSFQDASEIPGWAEGYVAELAFMGVMNGHEGVLDPRGSLTRAQAAKLLAEFT